MSQRINWLPPKMSRAQLYNRWICSLVFS